MALHASLNGRLRLPVIGSPMFIVSGPELVIAQCKSGVVGSFPALNARPQAELDNWLIRIKTELAEYQQAHPEKKVAPYAVNLIVHKSNDRLEADVEACIRHQVPVIITSLRAPSPAIVERIHAYGGIVLHDVISVRHAKKAQSAGVDGLILVCAGAGGHAGTLSPFALVNEVRQFFDGMILLSGSISTGNSILSAQALGADAAYMGTRFIASSEANAVDPYKEMLVDCAADDITYTSFVTGVNGNYLKPSLAAAGFDPDNMPEGDRESMSFGSGESKAWKDIWGSGQGIGTIEEVRPVSEIVDQLADEYRQALDRMESQAFTA